MQRSATGRIYFWEGGSLWIGTAHGSAQFHDHHAIQLSLAFSGLVRFRTRTEDWRAFAAVMIPPHLSHAFEATSDSIAQIFVEPETAEGRALLARFGTEGLVELPYTELQEHAEALRATYEKERTPRPLYAAAKRIIDALAGTSAPRVLDQRITRTIRFLAERVENPPSLAEAASHVALSPGRFRHLFVAQTGQSFRSYLLWLRLQRAIEVLSVGKTATEAAHSAGFADAAHLTRTFRKMMGIVPSFLDIN